MGLIVLFMLTIAGRNNITVHIFSFCHFLEKWRKIAGLEGKSFHSDFSSGWKDRDKMQGLPS
jgi:hypothetical protein